MQQKLSPVLIVVIVIILVAIIAGIGYRVLGRKAKSTTPEEAQTVPPTQMQQYMQQQGQQAGQRQTAPQPTPPGG